MTKPIPPEEKKPAHLEDLRARVTMHPLREVHTVQLWLNDEWWIVTLVPSRLEFEGIDARTKDGLYDAFVNEPDGTIETVAAVTTGKDNPTPEDFARAAISELYATACLEEPSTPSVTAPGGVA